MVDTYTPRRSILHFVNGVQNPAGTLTPTQNLADAFASAIPLLSRSTTGEPGSPSDGDAYFVPSGATGTEWSLSKNQNRLALYSGGWLKDLSDTPATPFLPLKRGDLLWIEDENRFVVVTARTAGTPDSVTLVGIETVHMSRAIASPTASEDIYLGFAHRELEIVELAAVLRGSSTPSVTWTIRHDTDRSATGTEVVTGGTVTTSTTTGDQVSGGSLNNPTVPANSHLWLETTAQSGVVDELGVSLTGYF